MEAMKNQATYETNMYNGTRGTVPAISAQIEKKKTILRNKVPQT